jgi:adenosine deaminase
LVAGTDPFELLPKIELHCHIEGTLRPDTVVDLARRHGMPLPADPVTDLYQFEDLDGFLAVFWAIKAVIRDRADWARVAYEALADANEHGVVHAELFFNPTRHLGDATLGEIVAGLDEGLRAAELETGATGFLIMDVDRGFGPAVARELAEEVVALRRAGATGAERVIGIGMDSTEIGIDPRTFFDTYALAAAHGLRRCAHQGEDTGADDIRACVEVLGAERIDHGLTVLDDPALVRALVATNVPLTVCPTSNRDIAHFVGDLADHPWPRMREAGLLATINTDNPAMLQTDLAEEYRRVASTFALSWDDVTSIALDAVEAAWLDDTARRDLRRAMRAVVDGAGRSGGRDDGA